MKIQHAIRAFTVQNRKAIKLTADNYIDTTFYKTYKLLTSLSIGEALVTTLIEKGNPIPLAHCMLLPASSRMYTISEDKLNNLITKSKLAKKYFKKVDIESACEILNQKIGGKIVKQENEAEKKFASKPNTTKAENSAIEQAALNPLVRTIAKELTRGFFWCIRIGH